MADKINWEKKDSLEDIKIVLAKILRRWYWVFGSLVIALSIAFFYIRWQNPVYVVKSSFISRKFDDRRVDLVPNLSDIQGFQERIEVNQQIPILKSEKRIIETLNRLDFGVTYMVEGRMKHTEQYKSYPYMVITSDSSSNVPYNEKVYLRKLDRNTYELDCSNERWKAVFEGKKFLVNREQNVNGWIFTLENGGSLNSDYRHYFIIHHPRSLMNSYRGKLNIAWAFRESAILNANINSTTPDKDLDFLRTYLDVVVDLGLEEKRQYLVNSIEFIDRYMVEIADTLNNYQNKIDQFRINNREIISESNLVLERLNTLDEEKAALMLEENYFDYLEEYIRKQKTENVFAPNLIGLDVPPLEGLMEKYMEQRWEDKIDLNEENQKNPLVVRGNEELGRIESNIYESVNNLKELNSTKMKEVDKKVNFYLRSVDELRTDYRIYLNMERMRSLYEDLYNQLMVRKTDANISIAGVTSDYQLMTAPYYSNVPIFPNKKKSYMLAIVIGLGLPIGLILLLDFVNPRVISKEDLRRHTDIPIIGSVGHFSGKTNLVVYNKPKSHVSESFRIIRANLEYIDSNKDETKIILITSSISGEGKTFCSTNLAYTYANMGKKTLLIGADMRRPALAKNFELEKKVGLSNFLSGQEAIDNIVYASNKENLEVIPGGHIPPNPAELLTNDQMKDLLDFAKANYEIVIFDTPPIGLVSDTVELVKHSFTPLLIVRQGVSFKKSLNAITEMYHDGKIKNLGIIMNDINYNKFDYGAYYGRSYGYGSGYGYGYYDDEKNKKGFLKRLFKG